MGIPEIIAAARTHLGLSQKDFGDRFGKTQSDISRYEAGIVSPPAEVLMRCLHILGKIQQDEVVLDAGGLAALVAIRLKGRRHRANRKLITELVERLTS